MHSGKRRIVLLALAIMLAAPSVASAVPSFCRNGKGHPVHGRRWCIEKGYDVGPRYSRRDDWESRRRAEWERARRRDSERSRRYRASAWDVVRNDRCLWNEYRRFASQHENPNKRQRFVERLANEGCDADCYRRCHPGYSYSYGPPPGSYYYEPRGSGVPVVDWLFGR